MQTFGQSGYPETSHWNSSLLSLDRKGYFDRTTSRVKITSPCFIDWFSVRGTIIVCFTFFAAFSGSLAITVFDDEVKGIFPVELLGSRWMCFVPLEWVSNALIPYIFSWHFHSNLGLVRTNGTSGNCSPNRLHTCYQIVLLLCISTYFFQSSYQPILTPVGICYQTIFNTFFSELTYQTILTYLERCYQKY